MKKLIDWFLEVKRDFPWREDPSPYRVWISEVMLQQTQAVVVIDYFLRWMERFPSIESLAKAELDEVIKLWEGLGYYSRARSLHEGARYIVDKHQGQVPSTKEELLKIKGLGPYTVDAILSFAFHKNAAPVDGNVIRVISRLFNIHEDMCKQKNVEEIRKIAFQLLPKEENWIHSEALIELGATVCTKKPKCSICPMQDQCKAYTLNTQHLLPVKSKKNVTIYLKRITAIVTCGSKWLIKRGEKGKVMSDLYEFAYIEVKDFDNLEVKKLFEDDLGISLHLKLELTIEKHSFTKYQVELLPFHFEATLQKEVPGYMWVEKENLINLAFSSGHRRILLQHLTSSYSQ